MLNENVDSPGTNCVNFEKHGSVVVATEMFNVWFEELVILGSVVTRMAGWPKWHLVNRRSAIIL